MKTVAAYNHKGGKTVTTVNFAYNLSRKGFRVLVADMDPQGNASAFLKKYDMNKQSVKEMLTGVQIPSRCIKRTAYKNLDIIPSNINLRDIAPKNLIGGILTLKNALWAVSANYDYCIIDCPPSVDYLIELIMAATDDVIVPIKPDRFSTDGLGTVADIIRDFGQGKVTATGLLTNFYRHKDIIRMVKSMVSAAEVPLYDNVIRRCSAVDHSILVRRPLACCASRSAAADYMDFTDEYIAKKGDVEYGVTEHAG